MTIDCEHLLVLMPSWMGDIVMATPALRGIRSALPEARITVSIRPGLEPILDGFPFVDAVETASLRGPLGPITDARRMARLKPDCVLVLPNSFRSALFARLTGARRRIGLSRDGRSMLLTDRVPLSNPATPGTTLDAYIHLVESTFDISMEDRSPTLETTPSEEQDADRLLAGVEGKLIVINPGANREDKRWPSERFASLADAMRERHDCTILVNGSPAEADLVESLVAQAAPGVIDLVRLGSKLGTLKAIVRRADLLVSNDTGPRHLAAAFSTPCVVLFGPTDRRFTLLPGLPERHLVAEPFLPEERVANDHPRACAIDRIAVGDVLYAAESLLGENELR